MLGLKCHQYPDHFTKLINTACQPARLHLEAYGSLWQYTGEQQDLCFCHETLKYEAILKKYSAFD